MKKNDNIYMSGPEHYFFAEISGRPKKCVWILIFPRSGRSISLSLGYVELAVGVKGWKVFFLWTIRELSFGVGGWKVFWIIRELAVGVGG